ncbi:MAG: radical SAM protein [Rhodospirillaceae bacterium]|jgi:radical SAM superfamily enzyme YgiQ (UPF0313 family)|nr:radical SAM protein [Rhodospirillaceae bacterium]MBT6117629.1 radical SAM protein [Rhodospirillaceae bacterium]
MARLKVAIIGHVTPDANEIALPENPKLAAKLLQTHNFTRVVTPEGTLADHVAYLKRQRGIPNDEPFTLWEMYLCAGLLLSSHLRRNGFDTEVFNYIDSDNAQASYARLKDFGPDIVVVSTTFVLTKRHLGTIGKRLREAVPEAFIVAGGHHVLTTLLYMSLDQQAQYLEACKLDGFIPDSQGEAALLDLCRAYPDRLDQVPNLTWRDTRGAIHHNARAREDNDINDTLIEFDSSHEGSIVHIRTARSCAFKCAFCSYPTIAGELALMDLDNVMDTLHKAKDAGVSAVIFVDDTFNVPRPRFEALVDRMIDAGLDLPWYSFLRCQYTDAELIERMAKSGCAGVFLGVESGSDRILKNMKKGAIARFYRDGVAQLRDQGITTVGSFIIGFPGETEESVAETRSFIDESGLDYYFVQPFYYLHHTPIHKRAADYNLTGEGLFWSHDTMNWQTAINHINASFLEIENATFINPDYTLWEIAYLRSKGMSLDEIQGYRHTINAMTRDQMTRFGITGAHLTSRTA